MSIHAPRDPNQCLVCEKRATVKRYNKNLKKEVGFCTKHDPVNGPNKEEGWLESKPPEK